MLLYLFFFFKFQYNLIVDLNFAQPTRLILNKVIVINKGDTLGSIIEKSGINPKVTYKIVRSISRVFDIHKLRIGDEVEFYFFSNILLSESFFIPDNFLDVSIISLGS